MVEPLRHRQTKEAATDMFNLTPPRHISTLPIVLKKSVFTDHRNFAEALVRLPENYLGDLIINPPFNGRLSKVDGATFDCK
jgi:hypothetical protein